MSRPKAAARSARFGPLVLAPLAGLAITAALTHLALPDKAALFAQAASPPAAATTVVRLAHVRANHLEPALRGVLGQRLRPQPSRDPRASTFVFSDSAGREAQVTIDWQRNEVGIAGPPQLNDQLARLVRALDSPPPLSGQAVQVLAVPRADPAQVRQAVEAYRSGQRVGRPASNQKSSGRRSGAAFGATAGRARSAAQRPTRLVAYLYQIPEQPAPAGPLPAPAQPIPVAAPDDDGQSPRMREVAPDLEIETLPDLDAIILRGRTRDVEELRRIIEEIERLSAETQPAIEVCPLRNVACEPLAALIKQVSPDLTGGRQGRVSVIALVKPNALLLIGWGEAVQAVKELIRKLDQPVAPETQTRVFRLRHAAAANVQTTVQGLFAAKTGTAATAGGLGPQAKVTADARTNSLIVQAAPRDLAEVELLIERLDQSRGAAVRQARIFRLNNSLATDVASVLQSAITASKTGTPAQKSAALELLTLNGRGQKLLQAGILDDVQITPDPRINSLVISAPAESMELLAALVEQLDSPAAVAQIKVFRIIHGDATAMVQMLRSLLPSSSGGPVGTQVAGAEPTPGLLPTRFSIDARTNSIIAAGSQSELTIIEALLIRLDEDEGQQRRNTVYRLKNAPATDVARAINEFLRSERQVQQAAPAAVSPFQQIESEVVVVPETVSNSLIISATPRFFDDIKQLAEKLDAEPPQVVIQVLIAEVALGNIDEFGIELGLQDSVLFDRSLLGNLITLTNTTQQSTPSGIITSTQQNIVAATNEPGFNFNNQPLGNSGSNRSLESSKIVGGQGLTSFSVNRVNNELGFGGLVLSASSESVGVLIRALQETRRLEVLSRPQVMTLDNQPAFVQVGKRVPRIVGSTINQIGQQNAIVLENVGLILGVTPRISPDGRVVMEVDAEKSEVGPIDQGIPVTTVNNTVIKSPEILLTTAQTTVSAVDGETIIIGGLITKTRQDLERRVPWLSDIPILGHLFRFQSHTKRRTEMLIILTPHIVRNPEDVERIKAAEEARMHWCLGDVNEIHGSFGSLGRGGPLVPTVYPDANPRGVLPQLGLPGELPPGVAPLIAQPPVEVVEPPERIPPGRETPVPPLTPQPPTQPLPPPLEQPQSLNRWRESPPQSTIRVYDRTAAAPPAYAPPAYAPPGYAPPVEPAVRYAPPGTPASYRADPIPAAAPSASVAPAGWTIR